MPLLLVRHPPVAVQGLCYGHTDVPLAKPADADALAAELVALGTWDALFSSPSQRCRAVADAVAARQSGLAVQCDARLMEAHFGAWENQRWETLPRAETEAWTDDIVRQRPPSGESLEDVAARVGQWWQSVQPEQHQKVLVISHGGPIRALRCLILGLPLAQAFGWSLLPSGHLRLDQT